MKRGTTRIVFLIGSYAIKLPRIYKWKCFLRGILANMDERMWYKSSPKEWQMKMCPSLFCIAGFILIQKRALPISSLEYDTLDITEYKPLPVDSKISNFGWLYNRIVLVDYADSRYFCSDCETIFACKRYY